MKLLVLVLFALWPPAQTEQSHGFRQLAFSNGPDVTLGAYTFHLAQPDRPEKPTAWEGPLTIAFESKSCAADVSLVTAVYAAPNAPFVVVVSYSGSNTYIHFVSISTCESQWETIKAYTEGVEVDDHRLSILPACDSKGETAPARCFGARVYRLDDDAAPKFLKDESFGLTKKKLGVGFTGEAKVMHPNSPEARIAITR